MNDLAVIVVSTNNAEWLEPCLRTVYEQAGDIDLDVVVADNESTDETVEVVRECFPSARVVPCRNRGFGHANNRALLTCDARYVLFLNPDTEILDGTLAELICLLDSRPEIGLAGVRQVTPDGDLYPTIRRFPTALRAFGVALGCDRVGWAPHWLRERLLDRRLYDKETACDWMTGSFMLLRMEALHGGGIFDERFFMSSEETDLAYRVKRAGWQVVHLPHMTILHHVHMGEALGARMEAQYAFARRQYAEKHFSRAHQAAYLSAIRLRYRMRLLLAIGSPRMARSRAGAQRALLTLRDAERPPYGEPPHAAVAPSAPAAESLTGAAAR